MNLMPYLLCYAAGIGTVLVILLAVSLIDMLMEDLARPDDDKTDQISKTNETEY